MACACALSLIGMVLVYALNHSDPYGRLGGTYLAGVFSATIPMSLSLIGSNVGGFTKKATVNAMVFVAYSTGNIVGPQLYLGSEAPVYTVRAIYIFRSNKTVLLTPYTRPGYVLPLQAFVWVYFS